jgi:hypothetical protein
MAFIPVYAVYAVCEVYARVASLGSSRPWTVEKGIDHDSAKKKKNMYIYSKIGLTNKKV